MRTHVTPTEKPGGSQPLNLGLGVLLGVVIGLIMDNIAAGIGIGIALGIALSLLVRTTPPRRNRDPQ